MAENYLAHHGILGMKWGRRRYQNPDGSLTDEGKRRYGVRVVIRSSKKKKTASDKPVAFDDDVKQIVMRSGNPSEILKYQDKLTSQELNEALSRVRSVDSLSDLANKRGIKNGTFKSVVNLLNNTVNAVNTVDRYVQAYNTGKKWFGKKEKDFNQMTYNEAMEAGKSDKLKAADFVKLSAAAASREKLFGNQG